MKLVKESISFTRGNDPKNTLGIGKRYLIEQWLEKWKEDARIQKYIINDDLSIDVDIFHVFDFKMKNFPEYIQFNKCKGHFSVQRAGFTSLKGCPLVVGGIFSCSENLLTSLEYCPKFIGDTFYCYDNKKRFTKNDIPEGCIIKGNALY